MPAKHSAMMLLLFVAIALLFSCSTAPTETEASLSIEGVWQESFLTQGFDILHVDGKINDQVLDTFRTVATLTMRDGQFTAETDRPASILPQYHQPPPVEGTYQMNGNTITFTESSNVLSAQDFSFDLKQESLKLSYLGVKDTLESGATIMLVPSGCLPWHNAWMKLTGTFTRVDRQER